MPKRNLAWILIIVLAGLAVWFGLGDQAVLRGDELEEFRPAFEVYGRLKTRYVERLNERTRHRMITEAIKAMVKVLDTNSEFIPPRDAAVRRAHTQGYFIGVGIEIQQVDDVPTVVTPIDASPALQAGIMPGDQIIMVDGERTVGQTLTEIADRIRGEEGTRVTLTITRPGVEGQLEFKLTRAKVVKIPVKGFRPLAGGGWDYVIQRPDMDPVGYIRVLDFVQGEDGSTMSRFDAALQSIRQQGVRGLIIDLRGNPGGLRDQSIKMADRFIAEGVIVTERSARDQKHHMATASGTEPEQPIVVLINQGSASASEIVAGAMACHQKAVLIGTRSFGKGTVQTMDEIRMWDIQSGSAILKYTSAYLFLPDGQCIHRVPPPKDFTHPRSRKDRDSKQRRGGIVPSLAIELEDKQFQLMTDLRRRLDVLYPNGPTTQPEATTQPEKTADELADELLVVDTQLARAIEVLNDPLRYQQLLAVTPVSAATADEKPSRTQPAGVD
jgi:carboxyl-terminal processing protease